MALAGVSAGAQPQRDVLWLALQACLASARVTGLPFPCLSVDPGTADRPGHALLRPPGARSHVVLIPTQDVPGIEAETLRRDGAAYFGAAWAARTVAAEPAGVPPDRIGIAVNSWGARSQDQLHLHLDCIHPEVLTVLSALKEPVGPRWTPLPLRIRGEIWFAMLVSPDAIGGFDPFEALRHLRGRSAEMADATFAALAATEPGRAGLWILARKTPYASGEVLLDHACAIAGASSAAR